MNEVCWPYYDPDFDSLPERLYGPTCRVTIDNENSHDHTIVKIHCLNKKGLLLQVVQVLTDMNLIILKGYISSDAGWFMDVFHVKDEYGNKVTDQRVIHSIQQAINRGRNGETPFEAKPAAIELSGTDRPGLLSEISATLADLHCNIVEAHAWSHNARLACVVYISPQCLETPLDDRRLATIEAHLTTVLRSTTARDNSTNHLQQEVKTGGECGLPEGGEGTVTGVERRLHQLMLSVRDYDDKPASHQSGVSIENCEEKGYSIVVIRCKDRKRLMFDTVCTLTDMQYVIFHASVDSREGYAFQEYFIRHIDGCALNTQGEKERVAKCLEAALERRVCEGIRLELCANNRVGLLSEVTRVLRENGLAVVRADVATRGEKAVNAFYVRDIAGNNVDKELMIKSIKSEMGGIDFAVKDETRISRHTSSGRPRISIANLLRYLS